MRKLILLFFMTSILSCNSDKHKNEFNELDADLIGSYEYESAEKSENHYIVIDTLNGEYKGIYYGTEDSGGHGVYFFKSQMEDLNILEERISFKIEKRELYQVTLMNNLKNDRDFKKDSIIGISNGQLKYRGEIFKDEFKLKCESEFGYCWDNQLN